MANGYNIGPTIGIDGEAEFRQQIREVSNGIKTLGTEMKVVTSAFIGQEKSVQALAAQNDVLGRTVSSLEEKLELQRKMLKESADAFGEADEGTQRLQQAVNRTQAELNKANAQIQANNELLNVNESQIHATGEEVEETAEKYSAGMDKIAKATTTAMKVAGAAIAAGAAAVGALAKASLDLYGDYEQLVGGVETLFGSSADVVQDYANRAYKTAGLSANEYMETITGFSASLIKSLGGDTAKAAELGDQAIRDMSDNANKMGTDISSLQNAYQGFAKQNYTMLDNLKLGYGGTKEEMERLLEDAGKLAGTKFDISSFADITQAIHVIQTQMGITGTTAKEASTTIQGSVNAMGAAWKNLLVGMAADDADLEGLIDNLVESVLTVADNLLPRLEQILSGMGEVIQELAPVIAQELPGMVQAMLPSLLTAGVELVVGLVQGIISALPGVADAIGDAIPVIGESIKEAMPELLEAGGELVDMLAQGILDAIPALADAALEGSKAMGEGLEENLPTALQNMIKFVYELAQTLVDNAPKLLEAAGTIVKSLLDGLVEYLPTLLEWIPFALKGLAETLSEHLPDIIDLGVQLVTALAGALIDAIPILLEAIPEIAAALLEAGADIGKALLEGVWEGIKSVGQWLMDQIKGFFDGIVEGVKDLLGIHSPSRVFGDIGSNMAQGLGQGWDKAFPAIQRDIKGSMDFNPSFTPEWGKGVMDNLAMDLTAPIVPAAANGGQGRGDAGYAQEAQTGELVINITETIDGAVLARNQYRYNKAEVQRQGPELVKGG